MSRPQPLFLMGNKRSGSTLTVNLINSHPRIYVSHESDIAWILYQARNGQPRKYDVHPLDSAMMMTTTLRKGRRLLKVALSDHPTKDELRAAFYAVQLKLFDDWYKGRSSLRGRIWRKIKATGRPVTIQRIRSAWKVEPAPLHKQDLAWIGDKKHSQHLDPDVRGFLRDNFPEARYVHIVRNPKGVVASMVDASKSWWVQPDYFKGPASEILEQWAEHEESALEAKEKGDKIHTVRLEDLCTKPLEALEKILEFLELEMTDDTAKRVEALVNPRDPNAKYESFPLPDVPRARRIMELYGYA